MRVVIDVLLWCAALPVAGAAVYLALLALAARQPRSRVASAGHRFDIVIPAHNEAAGIGDTLASIAALEYPAELVRTIVVADNCADDTAGRARAAGAMVRERTDPDRRGKGHALAFAFAASLQEGWADAVVVIDADTVVSRNLLTAFASRLDRGALCLQADYGVRNALASWRTRLMTFAFALYHTVRSLGREHLGLSSGLRGNGMAFTREVLDRVPHDATSVVEDVEYGIILGLHGVRVEYVGEAHVWGEMPSGSAAATSQRLRWEQGRRALRRWAVPRLLRRAIVQHDATALDLAVDLLVPPLAALGTTVGLGFSVAAVAWRVGLAHGAVVWPWTAALLALGVYLLRGWIMTGADWNLARDLLWAPVYIVWKLCIRLRAGRSPARDWVRTVREARP